MTDLRTGPTITNALGLEGYPPARACLTPISGYRTRPGRLELRLMVLAGGEV